MALRISMRINLLKTCRFEAVRRPASQQSAVSKKEPVSEEVRRPNENDRISVKELPKEIQIDMKRIKETREIRITSIFRGEVAQKVDSLDLYHFEQALQTDRSKKGFVNVVHRFRMKDKQCRGHLSFLYASMKYIDKFDLAKDLDVYNELLEVLPKYKLINRTLFDALWPKPHPQTDCAIDLLTKMEDNYVRPDDLTYTILLEVFGRASLPVQKIQRIAYWFDKYKDINPYLLPEEDLKDRFKVCKSALERMTNDCENIRVYSSEESEFDENQKSFLIGSQNEEQRDFISSFDGSNSLYVEGPFNIWMNNINEHYFVLRSGCLDISNPETHEDETRVREGMILGMCMTNRPISDALKSWLEYLQTDNPKISDFNIIFNVDIPDDVILSDQP